MARKFDCVVVGGGVIGLSIAYRLAGGGSSVAVIERGKLGREASWAGAGILPPTNWDFATHPREQLAAMSFDLHPKWSEELKRETGIDNGFRRCGALYVASSPTEQAALRGQKTEWESSGIKVLSPTKSELAQLAPNLDPSTFQDSVFLPEESQVRNPRHIKALAAACKKRGVTLIEDSETLAVDASASGVTAIRIPEQLVSGDKFCFAAGAWTSQILEGLGITISTLPVRGQMALFKTDDAVLKVVVSEGARYLVPREDGHLLAGSTMEEVGFDSSTTTEAIQGLVEFACRLVRPLTKSQLIRGWAGLRPATFDGFPYIGPIESLQNAWVACGHFRTGLLLSTGTAEVVARLMSGQDPLIDLSPFRIGRR